MTDHATDPCGIPAIRLTREKRIAIAAERFVRAELATLDARAGLLSVQLGREGNLDAERERLLVARNARNEAFAELADAVEEEG